MLSIENLQEWTTEYFNQDDNIKKSETACSRYDRLLMKRIRSQLMTGGESINIDEIAAEDPGKCLDKVKFETIPSVECEGKAGSIKLNLLDRTAEFIEQE